MTQLAKAKAATLVRKGSVLKAVLMTLGRRRLEREAEESGSSRIG